MIGGERMNAEMYSCRDCKWRDDCRRNIPCKDYSPLIDLQDDDMLLLICDMEPDFELEFRRYLEHVRYSA